MGYLLKSALVTSDLTPKLFVNNVSKWDSLGFLEGLNAT